MGRFKEYITLTEGIKEDIIIALNDLDSEELADFIEWLEHYFFEVDDEIEGYDDEDEMESGEVEHTIDYAIELIGELDQEDLEYVLDQLDFDEDLDLADDVTESVSQRFASTSRKKGRRKFQKSRAELRKTKAQRKKAARMNKAARKKYYRANKSKIKKYAKSYSAAVKSGKHKAKIRR